MSRILLVEANQAAAKRILAILHSASYEVEHVLFGLDAAKSTQKSRPGLILMDFNLPDIDGRIIALFLRQQLVDVPIVVYTSDSDETEARLIINFGCSAFLSNPFAAEELLNMVRELSKTSLS